MNRKKRFYCIRKEKSIISRALHNLILAGVMLVMFGAVQVQAANGGIPVRQIHMNNTTWAGQLQCSFLFRVSGGYERAVWDDGVYVEGYDDAYNPIWAKKLSTTTITPSGCSEEDVLFGSIYEGQSYNFVVTGRCNFEQSSDLITMRISKFDKSWNYISCCEVNKAQGVEIYEPFDFALCTMQELDGQLWVSTGRTGFGKVHHQGKQNLIINEENMQLVGSAADFWHSFGQYLNVCNGKMYQMELSEGSRTVYVEELDAKEYTGGWSANYAAGSSNVTSVFDFWSTDKYGMWSYTLGGCASGFTSSDTAGRLLTVGTSVDQNKMQQTEGEAKYLVSNVWIRSTSTDLKNTEGTWLSAYADGKGTEATEPHIVKVDDNRFLVLWAEDAKSVIRYVYVDAMAKPVSGVYTKKGSLSDVVPVNDGNGNIVWYSCTESDLTFYTVRTDGSCLVKTLKPEVEERNTILKDKYSEYIYKVTNDSQKNPQVAFVGCDRKKLTYIDVPATFEYKGIKYKVTSVAANAMKGNKYIKDVYLGKNIKKIGNKAFSNNRKLARVHIYTKSLKKSTVGKKVFSGSKKKLVVYVTNKGKVNAYKKLFRKKGISKKVRFVYGWN